MYKSQLGIFKLLFVFILSLLMTTAAHSQLDGSSGVGFNNGATIGDVPPDDPSGLGSFGLWIQGGSAGTITLDGYENASGPTFVSVRLGSYYARGDFSVLDVDTAETPFCVDTLDDYVGVAGPNACNAFDLFDVSNRETFGNGYMHWFANGAASNAWNTGISNPSAGILSFDTTANGNGAGEINVGKIVFPDQSFLTSAASLQSSGSNGQLVVSGSGTSSVTVQSTTSAGGGNGSALILTSNLKEWAAVNWNSGNGGILPGSFGIVDDNIGTVRQLFDPNGNIYIGNNAPGGDLSGSSLSVLTNGSVGVNTSTPGQSAHTSGVSGPVFEVNGSVVIRGQLIFGDNNTNPQSVAYQGSTCATGGDYAESVDVVGERSNYEPGDVLVLSATGSDIEKSTAPYSTMVSGIYSTKPGFVGRRQTTDPKTSGSEVPMAMVGIVPTKVTAESGAIHRGDLLVTSSLAGYAMKGADRTRLVGAVVGKAMGSLESGTGVIEVLVSLQ